MPSKKPVALIILDGFGYRSDPRNNAIAQAHTMLMDTWLHWFPHAFLQASGQSVGLLDGMPGNSLVGHLTMGSGRIIPQPITALIDTVHDGSFFKNQMLINHFDQLAKTTGTLHLMGLLSDGASHSHIEYVQALIRMAHQHGVRKIVLHAFLDGRDVPPQSASLYLTCIENVFTQIGTGCIGSIHGRSYAMDRNNQADVIQQSFSVLTQPQHITYSSWQSALTHYYKQGIIDEFIPPTQLTNNAYIHDGDGVIFFNIRADRARELTALFLENKHPKLLWLITGVPFFNGTSAQKIPSLFVPQVPHNTLLDVLEQAHKTIFTIAEQEKYAHITYFFSGGKETIRPHETRTIIPSYNHDELIQHPEMAAPKITAVVLDSLHKDPADFYLINYANADMIGHTGNLEATIQAITCLDQQLQTLYHHIIERMDGTLFITADHGKAEQMVDNTTGRPQTAHTTNLVPFVMIQKKLIGCNKELPLVTLADIAPFILSTMHLPVPPEMEPPLWQKK